MNQRLLVTSLAIVLCCGIAMAEDLKSGPQVGQGCAAFRPLNVFNAQNARLTGKKNCLV